MTLPIMTLKRKREEDEEDRVYSCKTCDMKFSTFQALGGHRAGHNNRDKIDSDLPSGFLSKKLHTCLFCFEKFGSGQALGGHMRKHRIAMEEKEKLEFTNNKEDKKPRPLELVLVSESDPVRMEMSVSESDPVRMEMSVEEESMCNCSSALVTRDFFPYEPVRVERIVPVEIVQVLKEHGSWLDLKLGLPGGDYKKD